MTIFVVWRKQIVIVKCNCVYEGTFCDSGGGGVSVVVGGGGGGGDSLLLSLW